ncbi:DNA-3-methyladenine glycosylase 1 [Carnimonas sp. R-84981]|uniref:DNA-3-methyladenine glycosylase I n=1 Tax=Carnimonas bestiolae TaxID=3402172 RepID=UPI003EDBB670
MTSYCDSAPDHPWHGPYHDHEYGFPVQDDNALFERLVLEINQAGLSWLTVLKKRAAFSDAFEHFDIATVANYGDQERARLLNDARIIRNRLKINAVIHNAGVILELKENYGSFKGWLDAQHPRSLNEWTALFKRTFRFTGPEIVNEFLMSTGYLPGAHREECPVYQQALEQSPPWSTPSPSSTHSSKG